MIINLSIPTSNTTVKEVSLDKGDIIFVLGANGVGKSALIQKAYSQNKGFAKKILAYRQNWFETNAVNMTAHNKNQTIRQIMTQDANVVSRWRDSYASIRANMLIFDLINSENSRARKITKAMDEGSFEIAHQYTQVPSPIQSINDLLSIANIPIEVSLENNEELFASKNGSQPYSIAELSDGERNVLSISIDVLTSKPDSLIIIDEPERHLHRSIISPLLSSLFEKRNDCAFIVSTHEVSLPTDNKNSQTLLIRGCAWNSKNVQSWDVDLITKGEEIPDFIKQKILGSKRKILFVEGNQTSLDLQIYQLIYPDISVHPLGDCKEIIRAVEGISNTGELHWLKALGLVDSDDRTHDEVQKLQDKGIIAVNCYSVESLYYSLDIIHQVAKQYSNIVEKSENDLFNDATSKIITSIQPHKDRLCARLSERKARKKILSSMPKYNDIMINGVHDIQINLSDIYNQEKTIFDRLVNNNDLDGLIARYPVRETPVLSSIVQGLGIARTTYESMVRKLIINDNNVREIFRSKLQELTNLIEKP